MSKLDDDIEEALKELKYYFRNRQKNLDNRDKFSYYSERCIIREERLARLIEKKKNLKKTTKKKKRRIT